MKNLIQVTLLLLNTSAFAGTPAAVIKAAKELKSKSVRTITHTVNNTDGNPCLPEGISYNIELQVKLATYNGETMGVDYRWETVKLINASQEGSISEVCGE